MPKDKHGDKAPNVPEIYDVCMHTIKTKRHILSRIFQTHRFMGLKKRDVPLRYSLRISHSWLHYDTICDKKGMMLFLEDCRYARKTGHTVILSLGRIKWLKELREKKSRLESTSLHTGYTIKYQLNKQKRCY